MLTANGPQINDDISDIQVTDVVVLELCFTNPSSALKVASAIVDEHPVAVYRVLTDSDMKGGTSVVHVHVRREMLDSVLGRPYIKSSGGTVLVTAQVND